MSWQQVAALALLVGGAITAAAFHNDVIAATLAGAAAGFAVNRNGNGSGNGRPVSNGLTAPAAVMVPLGEPGTRSS